MRLPRSARIACSLASILAVASLEGCSRQVSCVDTFDCRELAPKEGQHYVCVEHRCESAPLPVVDAGAGVDAGEGVDAGQDVDAGSQVDAGTKQEFLFVSRYAAGDGGLGSWELAAPDLSSRSPVAEAAGIDSLVDNEGVDLGFSWNTADERFYGVIDRGGGYGLGVIVRFDPLTDTLERVVEIPPVLLDGPVPYQAFLRRPLVTPDGKGLLLVAAVGGTQFPCGLCGTGVTLSSPGGVLHVDIDRASATFGKVTPVYAFSSYGTTELTRLRRVLPQAQLGRDAANTRDLLFVVAEGDRYNVRQPDGGVSPTTTAQGQALFLAPTDTQDWSKPWSVAKWVDQFQASVGRMVQITGYHPTQRKFAFALQNDTETQNWEVDDTTQHVDLLNTGTYSCFAPAVSFYAASRDAQLLCGGLTTPTQQYLGMNAKWFSFPTAGPALVREFTEWFVASPTLAVRQPLASTVSASRIFVNASTVGVNGFINRSDSLGFLPSNLESFDISTGARTVLVTGDATVGWAFVGPPALGAPLSAATPDQYVVTFTRGGGARGLGTVLKYDRVAMTTTAVPLGPASVKFPVGQPLALDNGKVLGPAHLVNTLAATTDRERSLERGSWVLDLSAAAPAPVVSAFPEGPAVGNRLSAIAPPHFHRTAGGEVWGLVEGGAGLDDSDGALLAAFSATTGAPTGEVYAYGSLREKEFDTARGVSTLASRGSVLLFFGPQQNTDVTQAGRRGHRAWCVDLADRVNGAPRSNFSLVNEDAAGPSAGAWDPIVGATRSAKTNELYVATRRVGAADQARLHRVKVTDCVASGPALVEVVGSLAEVPSTALVDASDGFMYFGTESGKLMRFDPAQAAVTEVANLAASAGTTRVAGYLAESAGAIVGVLADTDGAGAASRRVFRAPLAGGAPTTAAAPWVHAQDPFPGVLPVTLTR